MVMNKAIGTPSLMLSDEVVSQPGCWSVCKSLQHRNQAEVLESGDEEGPQTCWVVTLCCSQVFGMRAGCSDATDKAEVVEGRDG